MILKIRHVLVKSTTAILSIMNIVRGVNSLHAWTGLKCLNPETKDYDKGYKAKAKMCLMKHY